MLAQGDPRPPRAGPLGPAYVQNRYLLRGSAWAGLPAAEEGRGRGGRGVPRSGAVWSMYLFQALNSLGQPGEPHVSTLQLKKEKNEGGGGEGQSLTCRSGEAVNAICKWGRHFLVCDFPPQPTAEAEGSGLLIATRTSAPDHAPSRHPNPLI